VRVAAVVLAAGASSRLGRPKALIEIDGEPLVVKSARCALDAGCAPVVVVLGADADRIEPSLSGLDVRVRRNPEWRQGMSTSVRGGVEALEDPAVPADAVILLTCDQPRLTAEVIRGLRERFNGDAERMVACAYGGTVGVPALFGRGLFDRLAALDGDRGAQPLLLAAGDALETLPWPEGAVDVDRPEDLQ